MWLMIMFCKQHLRKAGKKTEEKVYQITIPKNEKLGNKEKYKT